MTSVHDSIPEVSIVVPIYNEFDNLPDLVARIDEAMRTQPLSYELIAVDDGSTDETAVLAAAIPFGAALAFVLMAVTLVLTTTANVLVQRRYRRWSE